MTTTTTYATELRSGFSNAHIRVAVALALLAGLVAGCLAILLPFLTAILWAAILVVSTWPLFARLARAFGGRRSAAAATMTLGLAALLLVPLIVLGVKLGE